VRAIAAHCEDTACLQALAALFAGASYAVRQLSRQQQQQQQAAQRKPSVAVQGSAPATNGASNGAAPAASASASAAVTAPVTPAGGSSVNALIWSPQLDVYGALAQEPAAAQTAVTAQVCVSLHWRSLGSFGMPSVFFFYQIASC
jgi:hypothetical protein